MLTLVVPFFGEDGERGYFWRAQYIKYINCKNHCQFYLERQGQLPFANYKKITALHVAYTTYTAVIFTSIDILNNIYFRIR